MCVFVCVALLSWCVVSESSGIIACLVKLVDVAVNCLSIYSSSCNEM